MSRQRGPKGRAVHIVVGLVVLLALSTCTAAERPVRVTIDANNLWVYSGEEILLRYRYRDVPFKPYVQELTTPNGLNVLLDAPSDHLHHHALMFAVAVGEVNFWEETPKAGRQQHCRFTEVGVGQEGKPSDSGFTEQLKWVDSSGEQLLSERRTIRVRRLSEPRATMLSWESWLSSGLRRGRSVLKGSHYFGLGLRFIRAMDGQGPFRNADDKAGTLFRGEERLVRSDWCAYTAQVDGRDVTVAMFGHPDNPRVSTTWFTMAKPFAYLAATLGLHEEPMTVSLADSVRLRYAVVLWDEAVKSEEIDRLYRQWLEPVSGSKRRTGIER